MKNAVYQILLVEEEVLLADAIKVLLQDGLECQVDVVSTVPKLDSYLQTKIPSVILLDLTMTDVYPDELITHVNEIRGHANLIAYTASSRLRIRFSNLVDAMLKKPFSIGQLVSLIQGLFAGDD